FFPKREKRQSQVQAMHEDDEYGERIPAGLGEQAAFTAEDVSSLEKDFLPRKRKYLNRGPPLTDGRATR
ncbi:MAG: hypothetical protein ABIJ86_01735, partial [Spirochaetota bacterium]